MDDWVDMNNLVSGSGVLGSLLPGPAVAASGHPTAVPGQSTGEQGLSGITGVAADVIERLGEPGVGLLTLIETVFPPIPSEVILPLAGLLVQQGQLNLLLLLFTATLGSWVGALILYWLGRKLGEERAVTLLAKLPLVDRSDFERAAGWFHRHGRSAVFFGRLLPGVRSLISLPAGASYMPIGTFSIFTVAGSLVWSTLLVGLGMLLGTEYELIDQYSSYLDIAIIAAFVGFIAYLGIRRIRR